MVAQVVRHRGQANHNMDHLIQHLVGNVLYSAINKKYNEIAMRGTNIWSRLFLYVRELFDLKMCLSYPPNDCTVACMPHASKFVVSTKLWSYTARKALLKKPKRSDKGLHGEAVLF